MRGLSGRRVADHGDGHGEPPPRRGSRHPGLVRGRLQATRRPAAESCRSGLLSTFGTFQASLAACLALPGRRSLLDSWCWTNPGPRSRLGAWLRVPAEPEPVEQETQVPVQFPDDRRDRLAASDDKADRQPLEAAEHFRAVPAANPAPVLVPCRGIVKDPVNALAPPAGAIEAQDRLGVGGLVRVACDVVDDLDARCRE